MSPLYKRIALKKIKKYMKQQKVKQELLCDLKSSCIEVKNMRKTSYSPKKNSSWRKELFGK